MVPLLALLVLIGADTTFEIPPEITQLIQVGIAGVVIIGFLRGWIWSGQAVKDKDDKYNRLEQKYDELVAAYQREIIPTLARATDALTRGPRTTRGT